MNRAHSKEILLLRSLSSRLRNTITVIVFGLGMLILMVTVFIAFDVRLPQKQRNPLPQPSAPSSISTTSTGQDTSASEEGITLAISLYEYANAKPYIVKATEKLVVFDRTSTKPLTISGTTLLDTHRIVVTHTPAFGDQRDRDEYTLKSYQPGDTVWKYSMNEDLGNIHPGLNEYVVQAWNVHGELLDEKTIIVRADEPRTSQSSSFQPTLLNVQWNEPIKAKIIDLYSTNHDRDRYLHYNAVHRMYSSLTSCTLGFDVLTSESTVSIEDMKMALEQESIYEVGIVQDGAYESAKIYVHDQQSDRCDRTSHSLHHFLQKPDSTFMRLSLFGSTLTKSMPWDGISEVDASGPQSIAIPGRNAILHACELSSCNAITLFDASSAKLAAPFSDAASPVYEGTDGCFLVKRKDGYLVDYIVGIDTSITWNDGTISTIRYDSAPSPGGCGTLPHHCQWIYEGDMDSLERVGTTQDGLEVYQEKLTPAQLEAMGSGESLTGMLDKISSLHELYWYLPRYSTAKIPTPQEFVNQHPAIYIKDPLGRILYFQGEQYGPQVECGKPVIYLYPEREQDISVTVQPTGGLTVSDPDYGNGWHVRATPESEIFNYADGEVYPYLFWEGHGAEYQRPKQGFVVARQEVPALLREKLAALGLNEQEIDDFREFWEPKLMASPFVFVTFLDQQAFNAIAPLTVEPKPDSIIRVFMDYEPLSAPIAVDPLPITPPKREGFTVIEWGGALHRDGSGICSSNVLLR